MWYLYGFVLLAGIANAVQPRQDATLAKGFSQPLTAGLIVGIGAAFSILVIGLVTGASPYHRSPKSSRRLGGRGAAASSVAALSSRNC